MFLQSEGKESLQHLLLPRSYIITWLLHDYYIIINCFVRWYKLWKPVWNTRWFSPLFISLYCYIYDNNKYLPNADTCSFTTWLFVWWLLCSQRHHILKRFLESKTKKQNVHSSYCRLVMDSWLELHNSCWEEPLEKISEYIWYQKSSPPITDLFSLYRQIYGTCYRSHHRCGHPSGASVLSGTRLPHRHVPVVEREKRWRVLGEL